MADSADYGLRIVFLDPDEACEIFVHGLSDDSRERLIVILKEKWTEFLQVYRAVRRQSGFTGLLANLQMPREMEWEPGWRIRWQIRPEAGMPLNPPPSPEVYLIQVLELQKTERA